MVTLRSLLSCSQGLVRRTLCAREAPTRSRASQKMKATSSLSAELLLCNFLSCFALKSQLLQDFQNALPLLATSRRQSLQKLEMAGADQIQDSTATESNTSLFFFSGKLLMCSFRSCFAKKHLRWLNFAQCITSAALNCKNELGKGVNTVLDFIKHFVGHDAKPCEPMRKTQNRCPALDDRSGEQ